MPPALTESDHSVLNRVLPLSLHASETKRECSLQWARLGIQVKTTWTLVETGSLSTIFSARFYKSIPEHSPPRAPSPDDSSFPAIT